MVKVRLLRSVQFKKTFLYKSIIFLLRTNQKFYLKMDTERMLLLCGIIWSTFRISRNEDVDGNSNTHYDYTDYSNIRHLYHAYTFSSGVGNRECLKVEGVNVDVNFKLGEGVKKWVKLQSKEQFYLIGIRDKGFTLINEKKLQKNSHIFERKIDLDYEVKGAAMFEVQYKARKEKKLVVLIVVNQGDLCNIFWYRIVGNDIEKFWEWPLLNRVTSLNIFKYHDDFNIVMAKDIGIYGGSLDLYRLHFNDSLPNIWFLQKIPLQYAPNSIIISFVVETIYMSVVMEPLGIVHIYKYEPFCPQTKDGKFVHHRLLRSENVTTVDSFFMASRNYLVTNGNQASIYIFSRDGEILPAFKNELGLVEDWLVLEVDTYRDDVILLARNNSGITMISWAGSLDGFLIKGSRTHCNQINERHELMAELSPDLSCLSKQSWKGAVSANLGQLPVAIIIGDDYSYLYNFNCSLSPIMDPEADILRIQYMKNELNKKWNILKKRYEDYGIKVNNNDRPETKAEQREFDETEEMFEEHGKNYWPSLLDLELLSYNISNYINKIEQNLLECESVLLTRNKPFSVMVEGRKKKGNLQNEAGFFNTSFAGYLVFDDPLIVERKEEKTIKFELSNNEVSANGILTFIPGYIPKYQIEDEQEIKIVSGDRIKGENLNDHQFLPNSGPNYSDYLSPVLTPDFDQQKKNSLKGTDSLVDIVAAEINVESTLPHFYTKRGNKSDQRNKNIGNLF